MPDPQTAALIASLRHTAEADARAAEHRLIHREGCGCEEADT